MNHTIHYWFFAKFKLFRGQEVSKIRDVSRIFLKGFFRQIKRTALPQEHVQRITDSTQSYAVSHTTDSTQPSISFSPHQYAGLQKELTVKSCSSADCMRWSWKVQWWAKLWSLWARFSVASLRGPRPLAVLTHCISLKEQWDIWHCILSWL